MCRGGIVMAFPSNGRWEEKFRAEGRAKEDIPKDVLRHECRVFAGHWLNVQREQIRRLDRSAISSGLTPP